MPALLDAAMEEAHQGCTIRICARERGYELCRCCIDLDGYPRFE